MKRVRIVLRGSVMGFVPIKWSIAETITDKQLVYAQWLFGWLNGKPVKIGKVLKGTIAVEIGV